MKRLLIFVVIFIGAFFKLYAQLIPVEINRIVNNSEYIFEGEVIRGDSYWNISVDKIYTSYTINISKIFKGNLVCGTVEILTEGGSVGDDSWYLSHNIRLSVGDKGIFACNQSKYEKPLNDFYLETNTETLDISYRSQGFFRYENYGQYIGIYNNFYNFDSLAQVYDAIELLTQLQYTDCLPTVLPSGAANIPSNYTQKATLFRTKNDIERPSILSSLSIKQPQQQGTQTNTLIYEIDSVKTDWQFFEFDVMLSASDNNAYLDNAKAIIQFDTTTFGTYIYTNTGVLFVDRGVVIADVSTYYSPSVADVDFDKIEIDMVAMSGAQNRFNLSTTPQKAVHVVLATKRCSYGNLLSFANPATMYNYSYYTASPNDNNIQQFLNIDNSDTEVMPIYPCISDFYPKTIRAGIGDILTIKGIGFGNTQGIVRLKSSDAAQNYQNIDSVDYSTPWTDTMVTVKFPSFVYGSNSTYSIGTGSIKIKPANAIDFYTTQQELVVRYGLFSQLQNNQKYLSKQVTFDTTNQVHRFRVDSELYNNQPALACVKKALCDWTSAIGVPFELDSVLFDTDSTSKNGINSIFFAKFDSLSQSAAMYVANTASFCGSIDESQRSEIDIAISDSSYWFYDHTGTQNKPANKLDFYSFILHELGHCLGLIHINDVNSLMYYTDPFFPPLPFYSRHINIDTNLVAGGNYILQVSQPDSVEGCANVKLQLSNVCNLLISNELPLNQQNTIVLYPNPFETFLDVISESTLTSYDIVTIEGKLIKHQDIVNREYRYTIQFEDMPQGIYILKIKTLKNQETFKIIKK